MLTQNRQDAVKLMSKQVDLVLVVGSPSSSNSNRLREVAEKYGAKAYLIDGAEDLDPSFETILNADEEFSAIEFITDEVLISIPMIPMHSHECQSYKDESPVIEQKRKNPFAVLEQLKNSTKE